LLNKKKGERKKKYTFFVVNSFNFSRAQVLSLCNKKKFRNQKGEKMEIQECESAITNI
jgi:hypothetical protein